MYDFEIRTISSNPNALFDRWPQIKHDVLATVDASLRDSILNMFNDEIGYFLALLKLLIPSTANLETVAGKLITFSDVRLNSIIQRQNKLTFRIFVRRKLMMTQKIAWINRMRIRISLQWAHAILLLIHISLMFDAFI